MEEGVVLDVYVKKKRPHASGSGNSLRSDSVGTAVDHA